MPTHFPGNSHNVNEPEKEVQPKKPKIQSVGTGKAVEQEPTFGHKFRTAFFGDSIHDVKEHLIWDVGVPFLKNAFVDLINEGSNRLFYGSSPNRPRGAAGVTSRGSYTPYGAVSTGRNAEQRPGPNGPAARQARFRDRDTEAQRSVEFNTRGEGEMALESLRAYLEQYGAVSRYEMLDVANITGDFTDNKWGWNDLSDARVTRTRQGTYVLDMPVAYEIQ